MALLLFALVLGLSMRRASSTPQAWKAGKPLDVRLVAVDDKGHMLNEAAAAAFVRMREQAAADGVSLVIESAWRSYEQQQSLYEAYKRGERKDVVAPPGWSNHQSGDAVDLTTARGTNAAYAWLVANAHLFQFYATVNSEPWHWEYRP